MNKSLSNSQKKRVRKAYVDGGLGHAVKAYREEMDSSIQRAKRAVAELIGSESVSSSVRDSIYNACPLPPDTVSKSVYFVVSRKLRNPVISVVNMVRTRVARHIKK